jgi:hypothetical protein
MRSSFHEQTFLVLIPLLLISSFPGMFLRNPNDFETLRKLLHTFVRVLLIIYIIERYIDSKCCNCLCRIINRMRNQLIVSYFITSISQRSIYLFDVH